MPYHFAMSSDYQPHVLEKEVQQFWHENNCFHVETRNLNKQKFYGLCAFPYPSGDLHVGHVRNYVLGDTIARYQRMQGHQAIYLTGWDAFGLPAENAAIEKGIDPSDWTYANIERMRHQLKRLGLSYDWSHEVITCDSSYYQWEQWLFIKLFEKGIAYRKTSWVNWDPVDQTILANEQVIQGRGWRSHALVERKAIPQWFLRITDYAEPLLQDLDALDAWPEPVKTMQRHWIGRSEGTIVTFKLPPTSAISTLEVFTTRVDTIMGVSYLAISPEHPLALAAAEKDVAIKNTMEHYRAVPTAEKATSNQEKLGVFTGFHAEHPISKAQLPVWIANFVDMSYGTGAVMAVPAHDARDFEFARKYQLSIQPVIAPEHGEMPDYSHSAYTEDGILINSDCFSGLSTKEAKNTIQTYLKERQLGHTKTHYRLKDWGVSRQRYWGTPIPIIYCATCGTVPVPLSELPVQLPTVSNKKAPPPLSQLPEFYETTCPTCKGPARRETDTFDTFVESSWYFIRLLCPKEPQMIAPHVQHWLPVDHYIIGIEHAVLHLLYARFFYKLLHTLGLLQPMPDTPQEPFQELMTLGMVLKDGQKMSKSKGNVVNPNALIERYGADTLRLFILFAAPPTQSLEWSDEGLLGASRFLKRLWNFVDSHQQWLASTENTQDANPSPHQENLYAEIQLLLQSALKDYGRYQFNTVVSSCMKLLNLLQSMLSDLTDSSAPEAQITLSMVRKGTHRLIKLLAPIVPHITHALWSKLNNHSALLDASWPSVDDVAISKKTVPMVIQINGRRRDVTTVDPTTTIDQLKEIAVASEAIKPHLCDITIQKIIVVPAKSNTSILVNIVATA